MAADVWTPYWLTEIARAQARIGDSEIALRTLDEAMAVTARTGSAFYAAETLRHRAGLRLSMGCPDAIGDLDAAAELAARQGATVFLTRANQARSGVVLS